VVTKAREAHAVIASLSKLRIGRSGGTCGSAACFAESRNLDSIVVIESDGLLAILG
jgi:hypothetical protein